MKNSPIVFSFILAALPFLLPVDAVADKAENAYVTVDTVAPISLCRDQMNFHVATQSDWIRVTVSAKNPYELTRPNPPSGTAMLRKGSAVPWSVICEDREMGGIYGAFGIISSCQYPLTGTNDQHEAKANIAFSRCTAKYDRTFSDLRNHFVVSCSCKLVDEGIHKIQYHFDNCTDCGSSPPEIVSEYYETGSVVISTSVFIRDVEIVCGEAPKHVSIPENINTPESETVLFVAEGINARFPCCSIRVERKVAVQ